MFVVVMVHSTEWLLPISEVHCSKPVFGIIFITKIFTVNC